MLYILYIHTSVGIQLSVCHESLLTNFVLYIYIYIYILHIYKSINIFIYVYHIYNIYLIYIYIYYVYVYKTKLVRSDS